MSESNPPAKRRFYQNILDAYRLTARTYPALPWMLLGTAAVVIAIFMLVAWLSNTSWIGWLVVGLMGSLTAALALLSFLARRALFSQVEETAGAVKVALSQIQRGWVIPEQPVAFTREQDLVWRMVGRAGVVLISEGPSSRVRPLLQAEAKRVTKVMRTFRFIRFRWAARMGRSPSRISSASCVSSRTSSPPKRSLRFLHASTLYVRASRRSPRGLIRFAPSRRAELFAATEQSFQVGKH